MNPITAYNGKAADYATHRLPYASESVAATLDMTTQGSSCDMADIAAGTGHVSAMFISHVRSIVAVEPNEEMRKQANRLLGMRATFRSVSGTAEDTSLNAASVDLITVGQAWHWLNPQAAALEFARVLRPRGWVVIIWNSFLGEDAPDLTPLLVPGGTRYASFPMAVEESWEQYIGGTRSAAAAPSVNDPSYPEFEQAQRKRFESEAVGGVLMIKYRTEIRAGRLDRRT